MAKIRTFICIELPHPVLQELRALQDRLRALGSGVSWSRSEGIHLTLKFLGDVEETQTDPIAESVRNAAKICVPFQIKITGTGAFPDFRRPRVFWVGVEEPTETLKELQSRIEDELAKLGFPKEKRAFSAHLTIGRVKSTENISRISAQLRQENLRDSEFIATEIIVMQSNLHPSGASYTPLQRILLQS